MAFVFSRESRAYKTRVANTKNNYAFLYQSINKKYALNILDSELYEKAYRYAKAEADSHFFVFGDLFSKNNWWKGIVVVLTTIVSIVATAFLHVQVWQLYVGIIISVIGGVSSIASVGLQTYATYQRDYYQNILSSAALASNTLKQAQETVSNQITKLLIYAPYAMLAQGHFFKDENPGLETYRAGLEAPNCMKAINGQKKDNELAKMLTNRAHIQLAGNDGYNTLKNPFPTAKFEQDVKLTLETLRANIKQHLQEVQKGISELAHNYFCFDDTLALQNHFNANIQARVNTRIQAFNTYSFLEHNKYYQKAQRLGKFNALKLINPLAIFTPIYKDKNLMGIFHNASFDTQEFLLQGEKVSSIDTGDGPLEYYMVYSNWKNIVFKLCENLPLNKWPEYQDNYRTFYDLIDDEWIARSEPEVKVLHWMIRNVYTCYFINANGGVQDSTYALKADMPSYRGEVESPPAHKQVEICKLDSKILLHRVQISPSLPQEVEKQSDEYEEYLLKYWKCFRIEVLGSVEKKDKGEGYKKDLREEAKALAQKYRLQYEHIFFVPIDEDLREIQKLELGQEVKDTERIKELKVKNDMFQSCMLAYHIKTDKELREAM